MDVLFLIRSVIFLVAGLVVILLPGKVYRFQSYVFDRIHVKYTKNQNKISRIYHRTGIVFFAIAAILFVYSVAV